SIPLDLALVPWCQKTFGNGALGGALAYVATEAGVLVGCLRMLPEGTFGWNQTRLNVQVVLAGLIMLVTTWPLRHFSMVIPIGVGVMTYAGLLLALRLLPPEDLQVLKILGKEAREWMGASRPAAG